MYSSSRLTSALFWRQEETALRVEREAAVLFIITGHVIVLFCVSWFPETRGSGSRQSLRFTVALFLIHRDVHLSVSTALQPRVERGGYRACRS